MVEYLRVFRHVGFFVFCGARWSESISGRLLCLYSTEGQYHVVICGITTQGSGLWVRRDRRNLGSRMPLRPLVVIECDEDRAYIREALMEVQAVLTAIGCVYNNFVVNDPFRLH